LIAPWALAREIVDIAHFAAVYPAVLELRMPPDEEANPWTTLDSRLVYENPWIVVREDHVIRPDGQPGIYGVVHFRNPALGIVPVDSGGRIWLVGQYRYTLGRYSWEIPKGGGVAGETPERAARRELREETGLSAGQLQRIATSHLSNSATDELAILFRATDIEPGESEPEGTERLRVRLVEWDEVWRMLALGEITDAISQIGLLHEALRRSSNSVDLEQ
jgi:8-oxo-dGTP pyrophosphatase MutT (NUDIX family)